MHKINMIVAMDKNHGIGKAGVMPWKLSADMEYFKRTTMACGIVGIGRKTWDSIPEKLKPLPKRLNVILSRDKAFKVSCKNCMVLNSVDHFLRIFKGRKFYIIGGENIYSLFMPYVSRLVVMHVHTEIEDADSFFPEINSEWRHRKILEHEADEENQYPFTIVEYTRRPRLL